MSLPTARSQPAHAAQEEHAALGAIMPSRNGRVTGRGKQSAQGAHGAPSRQAENLLNVHRSARKKSNEVRLTSRDRGAATTTYSSHQPFSPLQAGNHEALRPQGCRLRALVGAQLLRPNLMSQGRAGSLSLLSRSSTVTPAIGATWGSSSRRSPCLHISQSTRAPPIPARALVHAIHSVLAVGADAIAPIPSPARADARGHAQSR